MISAFVFAGIGIAGLVCTLILLRRSSAARNNQGTQRDVHAREEAGGRRWWAVPVVVMVIAGLSVLGYDSWPYRIFCIYVILQSVAIVIVGYRRRHSSLR
jgi:hypothetical protein